MITADPTTDLSPNGDSSCTHANYSEYHERCEDCGYVPTTAELVAIDAGAELATLTRFRKLAKINVNNI